MEPPSADSKPSSADSQPSAVSMAGAGEMGKLFVGGISWETSKETLKDYFKKYGDVTEAIILRDKSTGNARGFGFVSFADPSSADRALNNSATTTNHVILGRTVQVKKALPRGEPQQQHHYQNLPNQHHCKASSKSSSNGSDANPIRTKKIFVGGLSASLTEDKFKSYFEQFGKITDVVVMYDSSTHRPRGFGFITFDSEEAVEKAIEKTFHELNGKSVEVKKAVPKDGINNNICNSNNNGNLYNPRMGSGRGSVSSNYQGRIYRPHSPGYGVIQGYHPPPILAYTFGEGGYCGGYALGGYGGYNFQYANPRSPWHGTGFVDARSPTSYGNTAFYANYLNGGVSPYSGMAAGGYYGFMGSVDGKGNPNGVDMQTPEVGVAIQSQIEGLKLDDR